MIKKLIPFLIALTILLSGCTPQGSGPASDSAGAGSEGTDSGFSEDTAPPILTSYPGTLEQLIAGATDVVVGEYVGSRTVYGTYNRGTFLDFTVKERFRGAPSITSVALSPNEHIYRIEGTDTLYSEMSLTYEQGKTYLLILKREVGTFLANRYLLQGCVYLPTDDFSQFSIYNEKPDQHMTASPETVEDVYGIVRNNVSEDAPLYYSRDREGQTFLTGDELFRAAAKARNTALHRIRTLSLDVESEDGYQAWTCTTNHTVKEITVHFPSEAQITQGEEYSVLLTHIMIHNACEGKTEADFYQQYSKTSLWPIEQYYQLKDQLQNAESEVE